MAKTTPASAINLYDLTWSDLTRLFAGWGFSVYHADHVWRQLYQQRVNSLAGLDQLRPDLRQLLASDATLITPTTKIAVDSADGFTRKYLLALHDGQTIESVVMQFRGRATACVSTQVGCAMGCIFCATGQMGFIRNLSPGEIVTQLLHIERPLRAQGDRLRNVVLMGMGEPLHNYEATMAAVDILIDHKGLAIAPKHITLSTVGVVPGIRRLADEGRPIRLAVSLHAATDAEREALIPPARRWPLAELIDACRYYTQMRRRRIFFEWTLIEGENDTPKQARALGRLLHGLEAHINLIPLNPTHGYDGKPTGSAAAKQFQTILAEYDLPSTIRQRRGIDIGAGCGQLRSTEAPSLMRGDLR
jgi:23S rRNA (adenine2503-C2)-methyltransferase